MVAAYARPYALFTLVGIASEDDLDAPDLPTTGLSLDAQSAPPAPQRAPGTLHQPITEVASGKPLRQSDKRARAERSKPPTLSPGASENLRLKLMSKLEQLDNSEALASWAYRALPLKNQLCASDAEAIDAAFAARLAKAGESGPLSGPQNRKANGREARQSDLGSKEVTIIRKPVRERDREHLKFVAAQPGLVCGRTPLTPTTSNLPSSGRRDGKSATGSPSQFAGCITVNSTGAVMSVPGGSKPVVAVTTRDRDRKRSVQDPGQAAAAVPAAAPTSLQPPEDHREHVPKCHHGRRRSAEK